MSSTSNSDTHEHRIDNYLDIGHPFATAANFVATDCHAKMPTEIVATVSRAYLDFVFISSPPVADIKVC